MDEKAEAMRLQATNAPAGDEAGEESSAEYDPHLHRQTPRPTSDFETLVHLLKCSLGTGILAMPQAFARAGLVTGIVATIIVGFICTYCLHVLVDTQYALCKRQRVPLLSYPASARLALESGPRTLRPLAPYAGPAVDVFLVVYQLGICCVYIVFVAENVKSICDPYYEMPVELHELIILGPLIALNCIRDLKLLAPWSTVANLITFAGLGVVVYYLVSGRKSTRPLDMWGSAVAFPLFFGTVLFALTAVGVVVALESNMKTPKSFGRRFGVLNVGMAVIVALYVAIGALGYAFCSSECSDSITLDLPSRDPLAMSVKGLFAVAIFISYGLQCYVPVEVVWRSCVLPRVSPRRRLLAEYGLRLALCLITFAVAAAVPRLGLFISLFGALCLSALGLCFPAMMEFCVRWAEAGDRPAKTSARLCMIKDVLLFVFGIIGLVIGTYTALVAIVRTFGAGDAQTTPAPFNATTPPTTLS